MTRDEKRIRAIIERVQPKIRRRFLEVIQWLRGGTSLRLLADLLEAGRIDEIFGVRLERAASRFAAEVVDGYIHAAEATAANLGEDLGTFVSFDQTNERAVAAMQRNRLDMIREFSDEQRAVIRQVHTRGLELGLNPRTVAREMRASIGLTQRQEAAVANFRRMLRNLDGEALTRALRDKRFDRTIERAIADHRPLTKAQIDTMVERYHQRYIKYRSEVIGRTEGLRVTHEGNDELFRQAIDAGDVDEDQLVNTWHAGRPPRTRDWHASMNGQEQPFGMPFISGQGNSLMYPCDPDAPASETVQCRCARSTRILVAKIALR